MRRLAFLLLSMTLAAATAQRGLLHEHAQEPGTHAHPEHHQGMGAHTHIAAPGRGDEPRLGPCDPAAHATSLIFTSLAAASLFTAILTEGVPSFRDHGDRTAMVRPPDDVRVHGPPWPMAGLRAPPLPSA